MKEEALKLADELDLIAGMIAIGDRIKWGQDSELMENGSTMIRRLVEEFDKLIHDNQELLRCLTAEQEHNEMLQTKPLSDEEIKDIIDNWEFKQDIAPKDNMFLLCRAIEERHEIK